MATLPGPDVPPNPEPFPPGPDNPPTPPEPQPGPDNPPLPRRGQGGGPRQSQVQTGEEERA